MTALDDIYRVIGHFYLKNFCICFLFILSLLLLYVIIIITTLCFSSLFDILRDSVFEATKYLLIVMITLMVA